jgi:uncharacterized protein
MNEWTKVAMNLALAWVVIVLLAFWLQRWLLYFPDPSPPNAALLRAAGMAEATAPTDDGLELRFWVRPPAAMGAPTVVLFHGNAGHHGHRLPALRPLMDAGYGAVLASYRGYGGNSGRPSEQGFLADAEAQMRVLAAQGIASEDVVLWGESLGTGVVTWLAARHKVRGVILQAPYTSIAELAQELYWYLPARWLVRDRFDNLERAPRLLAPVMVIHGEADEVVPLAHGQRVLAAAAAPKRGLFLPGRRHNDALDGPAYAAIMDFISSLPR